MKVFGICCGRKNGNTEIMMKEAFRVIETECGAQCNFVRLQEAYIKPCSGCETCIMHHWVNHDPDFRCVQPADADHFYEIEQYIREADAVIVSSPCYNLLPAGILITWLNKLHSSGDFRDVVHANPKIGATFVVGGSDYTNFCLDITNMITMELAGSYGAIVDKCGFNFVPAVGAVVLEDEILNRMRTLGKNVADALLAKEKKETIKYRGEAGVCPICHGNYLQKIRGKWYCPQCYMKAQLHMENQELIVEYTEEAQKASRWTPDGKEDHDTKLALNQKKAQENAEKIKEKRKEYADYKDAVKLRKI